MMPKNTQGQKYNSTEWLRLANENSGGLEEILFQDKRGIYARLDSLGLPRPKALFFENASYEDREREIREFIEDTVTNLKNGRVYVRVLPSSPSLKRFGNTNVCTFEDFQEFIDGCNIHPNHYKLHIIQNAEMDYSGIIISDDRVMGELTKDHCDNIQFGLTDVLNFEVGPLDQVVRFKDYSSKDAFSEIERSYLYRALKMIGGRKFPQKGYFVFYVSDYNITFINHQKRGGFTKLK